MGLALESIVTSAVNPGAGPTAFTTAVSGDTLTVRNFTPSSYAKLIQLTRRGATQGFIRVRSPLLHDNVRGIMITTGQTPSLFAMPEQVSQNLYAQDTLIVEGSGGGAETDLGILLIYYADMPGVTSRLHMRGDYEGLVKNIKPITVAVTTSATIGQWTDTALTATEDLLHANTDYAIIGFITSAAIGWVAVKGPETNNFRVGGPGSVNVESTGDYFASQSDYHGIPMVPVFNAANKNGIVVSTVDSAASTAATITLICAELSQNLPN